MTLKIRNTSIISITIVLIPVSLSLVEMQGISYAGYWDEIYTAIMTLYLFKLFLQKRISRSDAYSFILLAVLIILGFIGNIFSQLTDNVGAIVLDAFWQIKVFVGFYATKYMVLLNNDVYILKRVNKISKIFIVTSTFFGIINLFVDLGMSFTTRYGIPSYYFIFGNEGRFGIIVAIALLIVLYNERSSSNRKKNFYFMFAIISMIFSTKGIVYIIIAIYFVLILLFKTIEKKQKINIKTVIPLLIVILAVGNYQIITYIMNNNSPRMLLIIYGFITAITYFPFGAGFATYGSEMAAKYYSPLYVKYGWTNRYALGIEREGGSALNDNYMATIIGEMGFLGLIIYFYLLIKLFVQINAINCNKQCKAMILSLFLCMMAAFLFTGIMKSSVGVLVFIVLGVFKGISDINRKSQEEI